MFPFQPVQHKCFKNTFLQNVIVAFSFKPLEKDIDTTQINAKLSDYFQNFFRVNAADVFWKEGLSISKEDNSVDFYFSNGMIAFRLGAKDYRSFFDSVYPQVLKLKLFLDQVLGIPAIESITIRKINVWRFKDDSKLKIDKAKSFIFSKELLDSLSKEDLSADEQKIQDLSKIVYREQNQTLTIKVVPLKRTLDSLSIVLDTIMEQTGYMEISKIDSSILSMNGIMFDSYLWSISVKMKQIMDK